MIAKMRLPFHSPAFASKRRGRGGSGNTASSRTSAAKPRDLGHCTPNRACFDQPDHVAVRFCAFDLEDDEASVSDEQLPAVREFLAMLPAKA
jgi:hypothetical protein